MMASLRVLKKDSDMVSMLVLVDVSMAGWEQVLTKMHME